MPVLADNISSLAMIFLICATFCDLSETNQELIMSQGGIGLLSMTAANAEDPQTLRMVAGAIANLCGNGKLSDLFYLYENLTVCVTKYERDVSSIFILD